MDRSTTALNANARKGYFDTEAETIIFWSKRRYQVKSVDSKVAAINKFAFERFAWDYQKNIPLCQK